MKDSIMESNKNIKVFLGGTCNGSTWRDELIPKLEIDYFNPVVEDWTPECQAEEERQKNEECKIHLYVITPQQTGVFSAAEMIESSCNKNVITVIYIQYEDGTGFTFDESRKRSWNAVVKMAQKHGAYTFKSLDLVALFLNKLQAVADYSLTETTVVEEDAYPSNGFDITTTLYCIYNCLY